MQAEAYGCLLFRRNHAHGLWLYFHVRNVLITECVFEGNWESGLFTEISRDTYVMRNLFIGNANVPGTEHDWGDPWLIDSAAGDLRPDRSGLASEMGVGWLTAPRDVNAWMAEVLPAWLQRINR